jgi:hypothetical protein
MDTSRFLTSVRRAAVWGVVMLLAACASAPERSAMQPVSVSVMRVTAPGDVAVAVTGGTESGGLDGPNIAAADFKAAIEDSLAKARAFERVTDGAGARYALTASIVRITRPMFGLTFDVTVEVGWSLVDRRQDKVLLRKVLTASGTATVSDAFAGVKRIRLAVEAASRASIEQLLGELAALSY